MTNYKIKYILQKQKLKVEVFLEAKKIPSMHTLRSFTSSNAPTGTQDSIASKTLTQVKHVI